MTDMTREEAIETLLYRVKCPKGQHDVVRIVWDNDIVCQAIDAAVEALEKQESIEYVMKLHLAYINKIANTSDISKKKAIKYIREHLKASTRSFVKWSDEEC